MLEIKPSESCDEGEWKCVVTNEEGSVGISSTAVEMESKLQILNVNELFSKGTFFSTP